MKNFLKLLLKCALVALPLFVLMFRFSQRTLSFVDGEIPYHVWTREMTGHTQEKSYDVIILGDSVANASYLPELLSDRTINLSTGGTSTLENYYTLLNWLEHNEAPETCYISFQDFHFVSTDCFWTRSMYAHRFSPRDSFAMIRAAEKYGESGILTEHYWLDFLSYELWLPNKYMTAFANASFNQRSDTNIKALQNDELHRGAHSGISTKVYAPNAAQTPAPFSVQPIFDEYYRKTIELCIENGIQVRLVRLPMPDNCVFTDEYKQAFNAYYDALREAYPGITVDWFPLYDRDCFLDGHHMNMRGGLLFSLALKRLYPEDFDGDTLSSTQAAGINDYLLRQIELRELLEWTAGAGYTALLYDQGGYFEGLYGGSVQTAAAEEPLTVTHVAPESVPEGESLLYVRGKTGREAKVTVYRTEDGKRMLQIGDAEPVEWAVKPGAALSAAILDRQGRPVCMKAFSYTPAGFTLC